jgi:hypothetical protein
LGLEKEEGLIVFFAVIVLVLVLRSLLFLLAKGGARGVLLWEGQVRGAFRRELRGVACLTFAPQSFLEGVTVLLSSVEVHDEPHHGLCQDVMEVDLSKQVHQIIEVNDADGLRLILFRVRFDDKLPLDDDGGDPEVSHFLEDLKEGVRVLGPHEVLIDAAVADVGVEFAERVSEEADFTFVVVDQERDDFMVVD